MLVFFLAYVNIDIVCLSCNQCRRARAPFITHLRNFWVARKWQLSRCVVDESAVPLDNVANTLELDANCLVKGNLDLAHEDEVIKVITIVAA